MLGFKKMDEPEWTVENQNRKKGSTTFKQCGWCEHTHGSCRYNCTLSGDCHLFPEYHEDREVKWDTPCKIKKYGKTDLKSFVDSHKLEIENAKGIIRYEKEYIQILKNLIKKATPKPPLPDVRSAKHFNVGDRIAVFEDTHWEFGTVVYGYRHHDGMVSFHLDRTPKPKYEKLPPNRASEAMIKELGKKWADRWNKEQQELVDSIGKLSNSPGCGICVPTVILKSEYDYFVKHQKEWEIWRDIACSREYNGEKISISIDPARDMENKKLHKHIKSNE